MKEDKSIEIIGKILPKLYKKIQEYNFLEGIKLDTNFTSRIEKFKLFLEDTKNSFDNFDRNAPDENSQIKFINDNKSRIFDVFNCFFLDLGRVVLAFGKEQYKSHQLYLQKELALFFGTTPFNKRIYEKPLGYPGDFVMMNYLYEDGYAGSSAYEKLIHRYTCELPISRANINRKIFFKDRIRDFLHRNGADVSIASIASGPAKEMIEVLDEENVHSRVQITFFDIEPLALEQVKKDISKLNKNITVRYVNENILTIIKQNMIEGMLGKQDLVYSAGLIDYMNEKLAKRITSTLYSILNDNGMLIIGNVSKGNQFYVYTEMLGEWGINYRDKDDMLNLTQGLSGFKKVFVEPEKTTKMNLFLTVEK